MEFRDRSRLATVPLRLVAYVLDCTTLFAFVLASQSALVFVGAHPFVGSFGALPPVVAPGALHAWVFASTTLPFVVYFALSFASAYGATFGQRLLRIRVTGVTAASLSWRRSVLRAIVLLVPFELNHILMFHFMRDDVPTAIPAVGMATVAILCLLYLLMPIVRADRRSVHDLAAESLVRSEF